MTTPSAGLPRTLSRTCVERVAILPSKPQAEAAIRRPRLGINAGLVSAFDDAVPRSIGCFQMDFANGRNIRKDFRTNLINNLLNASRFECTKHFVNDPPHSRCYCARSECRGRLYIK